jgi:hypothetical protein
VERFDRHGLLDVQAVAAIQPISWFGRLIGNTDMHTGHLSFRPTAQSPAGAAQPAQEGFAPECRPAAAGGRTDLRSVCAG